MGDVVTLMDQAPDAGLSLSVSGSRLVINGLESAGPLAEQLIANAEDALAELAREQAAADRFLNPAWRGACSEIAELAGWPELPYAPIRTIRVGRGACRRFLDAAPLHEIKLVLVALRDLVAAMPDPSTEPKEPNG